MAWQQTNGPIPIRLPESVVNWADEKLKELILQAKHDPQASISVWTERGLRAALWISHGYETPVWLRAGLFGVKVRDIEDAANYRFGLRFFLLSARPRFRFWAARRRRFIRSTLVVFLLWILVAWYFIFGAS